MEFDEYYGTGMPARPRVVANTAVHGPPQPYVAQNPYISGYRSPDAYTRNPTGAEPGPPVIENRSFSQQTVEARWITRAIDPNDEVFASIYEQIGAAASTCTSRTLLATNVFNLRPDFGSAGVGSPTKAVALWRVGEYGAGAGVTFQVRAPDLTFIRDIGADGLEVYYQEWGAQDSPDDLRPLSFRRQITSNFFSGATSVGLTFKAPHTSCRYWRPVLIFDWLGNQGAEPRLSAKIMAN